MSASTPRYAPYAVLLALGALLVGFLMLHLPSGEHAFAGLTGPGIAASSEASGPAASGSVASGPAVSVAEGDPAAGSPALAPAASTGAAHGGETPSGLPSALVQCLALLALFLLLSVRRAPAAGGWLSPPGLPESRGARADAQERPAEEPEPVRLCVLRV